MLTVTAESCPNTEAMPVKLTVRWLSRSIR